MDNETNVPLPEPGTRIRPVGWGSNLWVDVLHAAVDIEDRLCVFGFDEFGYLSSYDYTPGWVVVTDESYGKIADLFADDGCPVQLDQLDRQDLATYLVRKGVTVT